MDADGRLRPHESADPMADDHPMAASPSRTSQLHASCARSVSVVSGPRPSARRVFTGFDGISVGAREVPAADRVARRARPHGATAPHGAHRLRVRTLARVFAVSELCPTRWADSRHGCRTKSDSQSGDSPLIDAQVGASCGCRERRRVSVGGGRRRALPPVGTNSCDFRAVACRARPSPERGVRWPPSR